MLVYYIYTCNYILFSSCNFKLKSNYKKQINSIFQYFSVKVQWGTKFWTVRDAILYIKMFNSEDVPKMVFSTERALAVLGKLKFYVLTFVDYKLFQINKF